MYVQTFSRSWTGEYTVGTGTIIRQSFFFDINYFFKDNEYSNLNMLIKISNFTPKTLFLPRRWQSLKKGKCLSFKMFFRSCWCFKVITRYYSRQLWITGKLLQSFLFTHKKTLKCKLQCLINSIELQRYIIWIKRKYLFSCHESNVSFCILINHMTSTTSIIAFCYCFHHFLIFS